MNPKIATYHDDDYAGGEADPEDLFFGRNVRFHLLRDWVQPTCGEISKGDIEGK